MSILTTTHESVREYYGRVLQKSSNLKTDACCIADSMPQHVKEIVGLLAPEITDRFYGCGSPIPPAIEGRTILDLGCGTGRDAFICAKLVGPEGQVIGLDMTEEQLQVAQAQKDQQASAFGFSRPNTRFVHGFMEDLAAAGIDDESVDVVLSNCVINLAPDKKRVFSEIMRVLKPGGELLFSDIFVDRRLPAELSQDPVLLGECLAGAMYTEDFRRLMLSLGVPDYRVITGRPLIIGNNEIRERFGEARFDSLTLRAFKLASLEDRCEDFGQVATYQGTIPNHPHTFALDDHHQFVAHKPIPVCGNTAAMLEETRLGDHFDVQGDRSRHFGLFLCGPEGSTEKNADSITGGCC